MTDFATAARAFCGALLDAASMPLAQRVEALGDTLALVVLAGRALPPAAAPDTEPPPGPAADGWPGLASFEEVWRTGSPLETVSPEPAQLSEVVLEVERWLWAGLQAAEGGDLEAALAWWAGGWPTWSADALLALAALHHAGLRFREVPRSPRAHPADPVVLVGHGTEAAPSLPDGPAEAPVAGVLGVRFEPLGVGALVRELHPSSPARGVLEPGDVVITVDGVELSDPDPAVVRQQVSGPVGRPLRCEVYRDGETRTVELVPVPAETLT